MQIQSDPINRYGIHLCGSRCKIETDMCAHGMHTYSTVHTHTVYTQSILHMDPVLFIATDFCIDLILQDINTF